MFTLSIIMAIRGIGIEGVASQIGALSREEFKVNCEELIESLMYRFKAERDEVVCSVNEAVKVNVVYEENGRYCLR